MGGAVSIVGVEVAGCGAVCSEGEHDGPTCDDAAPPRVAATEERPGVAGSGRGASRGLSGWTGVD